MSSVAIDQVALTDPLPAPISDFEVERPAAGGTWRGPSLELSGWVLGTAVAPALLEVFHAGRVIRRLPIDLRRPDVAREYPGRAGAERSGFGGVVTTLGLPDGLRLDLAVVLESGERHPVAVIHGRRTPVSPAFEPSLQPLMVTSLGRMASTWMMSLLAAHPQIVALRQHPYECQTAKYWLQVLRLLAEPRMQPLDAEVVHANRWWVGANPYFRPELVQEPRPGLGLFIDEQAELCQKNIDRWYLELAHHQVKEKARYFAEKFLPSPLQPLVRELYAGPREVFVVRDFRDWICSILAFDKKRGFHGFGRRAGEPVEDYVRRHGRNAFELLAHWRARGGDAHLVRYEDLVLHPEATLRRLLDYLELDTPSGSVTALLREAEAESRSFGHHRTSVSARASVGRWRRDLPPAAIEVVQELFAEVLEAFGYEGSHRVDDDATVVDALPAAER